VATELSTAIDSPETGFEEINGDLLEADFLARNNFRMVRNPSGAPSRPWCHRGKTHHNYASIEATSRDDGLGKQFTIADLSSISVVLRPPSLLAGVPGRFG